MLLGWLGVSFSPLSTENSCEVPPQSNLGSNEHGAERAEQLPLGDT